MSTIHGIDLGTSTTIVARLDEAGNPAVIPNAQGEHMTLTSLYFEPDGTILTGTEAWHSGIADPSRFVEDAKRFMGSGKPVCANDGKEYQAGDLLQIVLERTKETVEASAGQPPESVVITRPANWVAAQKDELLEAAKRAGLKVVLSPPEPTAALFGSGAHKRGDGFVLVLDIGGGTTDTTLAEIRGNTVQICATNGVPQLGGRDFNAVLGKRLLERFAQQFGFQPDPKEHIVFLQDMAQKIEHAKRMLSTKNETRIVLRFDNQIFDAAITRDEYQAMTAPLVTQAINCARETLDEAGVKPADTREFLLIGAQSQDPAFAEALEKTFGRKPWAQADPVYAVAKGAVILGRVELEKEGRQVQAGNRFLPPLNLTSRDITAHAIGVAALNDAKRLVQSVIIPKGTAIPSQRVERFKLAEPGQTGAHIELLEGPDDAACDECQRLGHFDLDGVEAVQDRDHIIEVEFRLDKNAMLTATARDPHNGASAEMTIDYRQCRDAKATGQAI